MTTWEDIGQVQGVCWLPVQQCWLQPPPACETVASAKCPMPFSSAHGRPYKKSSNGHDCEACTADAGDFLRCGEALLPALEVNAKPYKEADKKAEDEAWGDQPDSQAVLGTCTSLQVSRVEGSAAEVGFKAYERSHLSTHLPQTSPRRIQRPAEVLHMSIRVEVRA